MKDRSDESSHHERKLLPRSDISLQFPIMSFPLTAHNCMSTRCMSFKVALCFAFVDWYIVYWGCFALRVCTGFYQSKLGVPTRSWIYLRYGDLQALLHITPQLVYQRWSGGSGLPWSLSVWSLIIGPKPEMYRVLRSTKQWCDGSSDGPIELLSCLWDDAYKRTLAVNRKE